MAITKTKHIKATLKKAIDYICNEKKTDEGILISSFACAAETADLEFDLTGRKYNRPGKYLAHHLIQSFKPGEVTAEEAHQIGMEWAQAVLGWKYEFVLSTHVDRGHIHNHLIFNSTSFVTGGKYNDCKRTLRYRMRESDRICREHGLSVITEKSGIRGSGYYEYVHKKRGTSWKEKIRTAIDEAVSKSSDWDEFITIMELNGCDCARNKNGTLKFKILGQERFTRADTLGEKYMEDMIRDRIKRKDFYQSRDADSEEKKKKPPKRRRDFSLIVDLQNSMQTKSAGYRQAVAVENVNQLFKTIAFLEKNNFQTYEDFMQRYDFVKKQYDEIRQKLKPLEQEETDVSEKINYCRNFFKVAKNARLAIRNPALMGQYKDEVAVYNSCMKYFKEHNISLKDLKMNELWEEKKKIGNAKSEVAEQLRTVRSEMKNLNVIKANLDMTLGYSKRSEEQQQKEELSEQNKEQSPDVGKADKPR